MNNKIKLENGNLVYVAFCRVGLDLRVCESLPCLGALDVKAVFSRGARRAATILTSLTAPFEGAKVAITIGNLAGEHRSQSTQAAVTYNHKLNNTE